MWYLGSLPSPCLAAVPDPAAHAFEQRLSCRHSRLVSPTLHSPWRAGQLDAILGSLCCVVGPIAHHESEGGCCSAGDAPGDGCIHHGRR